MPDVRYLGLYQSNTRVWLAGLSHRPIDDACERRLRPLTA